MATTAATKPATGAEAMVAALRRALRGEVIDRGHPAYDQARRVWNGLIDRHPAVIARCAGPADVVEAVRVVREYRPVVSIRGGGHQVAGSAVCDDGLVIDLSGMKGVQVDPTARTARVQAGVTWGELDRETQLFGLATPGGEVSATGIAGLTLGGGMGVLMRAHGLSCDNLRSIQLVTADGMVRTASPQEHPELFWAARGGGRGLGVVTSFEFGLHRLGPEVAVALVLYPYQDAARLLRAWPQVTALVPETVTPELALWSVPLDPAIPQQLHGAKTVVVSGVHAGAPGDADAALAPLRQLAEPLADLSGSSPYLEVQRSVDAAFPDGGRYYMLSHFMGGLTDQAIQRLLECDARRPTPETVIVIRTLGGAIAHVGAEDSAYAHRSARFNLSIDAAWSDPMLDDTAVGWARFTWAAIRPFATGGVYVNFAGLGDESHSLRRSVLGANQQRLERIRRAYDPDGLFDAAAHRP
ncbi:MAG TPA: FAD-binding oxidoreductase [Actinomycetes bacterium]|jgi:FAD/FMN-containing dehydrogenase|nr:FAD-binding oxidoreductase [Actinomycetes bacterium]